MIGQQRPSDALATTSFDATVLQRICFCATETEMKELL
jgi:hypothetical protein